MRANDIANMGFAEAANCPVLLVGDIDRGGVFAQLVGKQWLLEPALPVTVERGRANAFQVPWGFVFPIVMASEAGATKSDRKTPSSRRHKQRYHRQQIQTHTRHYRDERTEPPTTAQRRQEARATETHQARVAG